MNPQQDLKRFSISKSLLFLCLPLAFSCKSIHFSEEQDYGVRLVSLEISPEEYGLLNGQLLSKRPAQVSVRVAGEFKVDCNASYAGRSSIDAYRKSYDIDFCNEKYNKRSHYRLSSQAIDKTMLRSIIGYELFKEMKLEVPKTEFASAYINKKYQGLYLFMETVDKEFFKAHKVPVYEIYKARYGNAGFRQDFASKLSEAFSYDGKGEDNFTYLEELYKLLWLEANEEVFVEKLKAMFDVDGFLAYTAVALSINHWDGFDNNYFLAFDQDQRKLTTVPWDLDRIWEKPDIYEPENLLERNLLLVRMLKAPEFKTTFLKKLRKIQDKFPVDTLIARAQELEGTAKNAYADDPILGRYKPAAFEELHAHMRIWDEKMKAYLAKNPAK
jgi:spore coat protein H